MSHLMSDAGAVFTSNPFRSANIRPGATTFVAEGITIGSLIQRLVGLRQAQIIGPHGSGKSTLVQALHEHCSQMGWQVRKLVLDGRCDSSKRHWGDLLAALTAGMTTNALCVIDGFELLPWWRRRQVIRDCRRDDQRLLITAHDEMGLPTLYRTCVDLRLAKRVVELILQRESSPAVVPEDQVRELLDQHRGNLRELLFALYDEYERGRLTIDSGSRSAVRHAESR
jgi:hypothetical protein